MPTAVSDFAVTTSGSSIAIAVIANDTGDNLSLVSFSDPANGSVASGANNALIYTPAVSFFGQDIFNYTVQDGSGSTSQGTVTVTVIAANDAPTAVDDTIDVLEGSAVVIPILDNDSDPDGDEIILAAVSMPSHGSIEVLPDQSIRYAAQPTFVGVDSFRYTISDGRGSTSQSTVTVNVLPANSPPLALDDYISAIVGVETVISPLDNDSDTDGDVLTLVGFSLPSLGQLNLAADGRTFEYVSSSIGEDGFTYTVRDDSGATSTAFVAISVAEANAPPTPSDDAVATDRETPVVIDILANDSDPDGDTLTIVALSLPVFGRLEVNLDRTLTYTPFDGFAGSDEFTYTVRDGRGASATARVSLTVNDTTETFDNGFASRKRFVVPPQSSNSVLAEDFVLLVSLTDEDLKPVANGGKFKSTSGFDMQFETASGVVLDHDVELLNLSTGELKCWVRIPSWDLSQSLEVQMYFDADGITDDPSNPGGVWQGYVARWNAVEGSDSTGNNRNLTVNGVVQGELLGPAGSYDGNAVMTIADASFQNGLSEFTVQAIVKADESVLGTDSGILTEGAITGSDSPAGITLQYLAASASGTPNIIHLKARCTDGNAFVLSSQDRHTTGTQIIHGTWKSGEIPKLYLDGAFENTSGSSDPRSGTTIASGPIFVGTGPRNSANGGWSGLIDEVRFVDRAKDPEIIASEAANMGSPTLFYGIGPREDAGSQGFAPIAVPQRLTMSAGEALSIPVLEYAVDPDGDTNLVVQSVAQPANGSASIVGSVVRYVANAGFFGTDQFTYVISDGANTSTATIQVTVQESASLDPVLPNGKRVLLMNEAPLRTVFATANTFQSVINNAQPGDRIILRSGSYGAFTISKSGTELAPIVIAAEQAQGVTLTAQGTIYGSWIKFDNLRITGGGHFEAFDNASNIRFDRCTFEDNTNSCIRLWADVRNVRVSRCVGRNGREFFIYCDVDSPQPPGGPQFVQIDHCFFSGYNTKSCIRLGDTSHQARTYELNAVVEYNYFDTNTGHRELIVGKSSRNWVRYNTITGGSRGDIAIRQGSFWNVYGNYSIGAGGITVVATENNVYNNYIEGGVRGIWLMSGDNTWDSTTDQRPIYDRAERCIIANNTIVTTTRTSEGIGIGENFGQTGFKVTNCDVINNLVFRVSGTAPLIEKQAETGNRLANNIVSDSSGFTGGGVTVTDPKLVKIDGIYRPANDSPVQDAGSIIDSFGATDLSIEDDINGLARGARFDVGAEQVNAGPALRSRIEETDVGTLIDDPYELN